MPVGLGRNNAAQASVLDRNHTTAPAGALSQPAASACLADQIATVAAHLCGSRVVALSDSLR
jgi:hypothetical protein